MPVTHVPEMGAEDPYQKTGTINRYENRACPIRYLQKLIPEKLDTKLHVRRVRTDIGFLVPVFGGDFW